MLVAMCGCSHKSFESQIISIRIKDQTIYHYSFVLFMRGEKHSTFAFDVDTAISMKQHIHMQRTTILLPEDLHRKAAKEAQIQGISLSELIRQRLADCVESKQPSKAAFFSRQPWSGSGADDMAAKHDDYLYEQ